MLALLRQRDRARARLESLERRVASLTAMSGDVGRRAIDDFEFARFRPRAERIARMLVDKLDREIAAEAKAKAKKSRPKTRKGIKP